MNMGLTTLGEVGGDGLLASLRMPRQKQITLQGGQGLLKRGTLLQLDVTGLLYVVCDDVAELEGFLWEDVETGTTGADDVAFYMAFDADLNLSAVTSSVVSLKADYYPTSGLNIIGAV